MKDVCSIAEPLWKLCKEGVPWQWRPEVEHAAFMALKDAISTKCMGYFRIDWETRMITDASPVGLGAVLVQFNSADRRGAAVQPVRERGTSVSMGMRKSHNLPDWTSF